MAKGEANKVWVVPSDFGSALQGFTKLLGAPGEDGVFRYTPSPVEPAPAGADDDADEVADWFSTQTDPAIAQAVAKAEAEARRPVQQPGYSAQSLSVPPVPPAPPTQPIEARQTPEIDPPAGQHAR